MLEFITTRNEVSHQCLRVKRGTYFVTSLWSCKVYVIDCPCLSNLEELHIGMYFMCPLRLFLIEHRDPIRHQEEVMALFKRKTLRCISSGFLESPG